MARRGQGRPIDGVLLLDKPSGFTSNQALQQAKRLLEAGKAGHTGSLDPLATGLLPLCFGEATKLSQFLLDARKRYWALIRLGVTTDTYDSAGSVLQTRLVDVSRSGLEATLIDFQGEIEQTPPMYSALKRDGRPLYELARKGLEVERDPRSVMIDELVVHAFEGDRLEIEVVCSKGTYVRSLAHDIGERLGCGAHVAGLRRLAVGDLRVEHAVSLAQLAAVTDAERRAQYLVPADQVLGAIPGVHLTALAAHYLVQGQSVTVRHGHNPGWVRLYDPDDRFLGMGQILDDGRVAPRRLLAQKP